MSLIFNAVKPINEVYFGKTKELLAIEKQLDIFRSKYILNYSFKNVTVNSDADLLKFNRMVEDFFGFGCFSLQVITASPKINAYTVPIDHRFDVINMRKNLIANKNTFKFNKDASYTCIVFINSGIIFNPAFTTEEVLAAILHEIGHNFCSALDRKNGVLANLLSAIVLVSNIHAICKKINDECLVDMDIVKNIAEYTNIYRTMSVKFNLWLRENNYIIPTIVDSLEYIKNVIKYAKTIVPSVKNILSLGTIKILSAAKSTFKQAINPETYIIMPIVYRSERSADNFVTMYGYGPAFTSFIDKTEHMMLYRNSKTENIINKVPILSNIYAINMNIAIIIFHALDPHPIAFTRVADQLYLLETELQKTDLDPKMRKTIEDDIKICRKNLNKMMDTSKGLKNKQILKSIYYKWLYNNTNSKDLKDILLDDVNKFSVYDKTYNEKINM